MNGFNQTIAEYCNKFYKTTQNKVPGIFQVWNRFLTFSTSASQTLKSWWTELSPYLYTFYLYYLGKI